MTRKFLLLFFIFMLLLPFLAEGRSAFSPRQTGLEPPGSPKRLDNMSNRSIARTPAGGMGYTDAYGNPVEDVAPPEKKVANRPKPEWMQKKDQSAARLPDAVPSSPLWKFQ